MSSHINYIISVMFYWDTIHGATARDFDAYSASKSETEGVKAGYPSGLNCFGIGRREWTGRVFAGWLRLGVF